MSVPSPRTGTGPTASVVAGPGRAARSLAVALVGAVVLTVAAPAQASAEEFDRAAQEQLTEREQRELEREARREQREAERAARRAAREADRAERRAERAAERGDREAERLAERERRQAEREQRLAERAAERAEREAERAAERAEREAERAERRAERAAERDDPDDRDDRDDRDDDERDDDERDDDERDERDGDEVLAPTSPSTVPDLSSPASAPDVPVGPEECATFAGEKTHVLSRVTASIGADAAHAAGVDGQGIDIAIVDTGVSESGGLRAEVVPGIDLSFDSIHPDRRGRDLHGHGTAMASIAASRGGFGGDGVAPGARIVDVRVGSADGSVDVSQVIAALDWIVANKDTDGRNIRVVSLSYNTDSTQPYELDPLARAVENAWHAGLVVVVAGGNDGLDVHRLGNPATNPYVIAVAGADLKDDGLGWRVAPWSSAGDGMRNPDLVAPGHQVLAASTADSFLAQQFSSATCLHDGDTYLRGSGSSQSAAVVAGAAALLLDARPELSPDEVKHLLMSTADALGLPETRQGRGLIDVDEALATPTPGQEAEQAHPRATGLGSLEQSRGTAHVGSDDDRLTGEVTAFGTPWDGEAWVAATEASRAWEAELDDQGRLTGATWSGATWSGATWSGATWSGATWSGATWSGATWSGATWSGATWSGATWSGATWSGATWSGAAWAGSSWQGASWT